MARKLGKLFSWLYIRVYYFYEIHRSASTDEINRSSKSGLGILKIKNKNYRNIYKLFFVFGTKSLGIFVLL